MQVCTQIPMEMVRLSLLLNSPLIVPNVMLPESLGVLLLQQDTDTMAHVDVTAQCEKVKIIVFSPVCLP